MSEKATQAPTGIPHEENPMAIESSFQDLDNRDIAMEVRDFCREQEIEGDVDKAINLAHKHFAIQGKPWFQVVHDPEADEHYLSIHFRALGPAERVFEQSEAFLDVFVTAVDRQKQKCINVVYHSL
jgi:hypothetical protein